MTVTRTRDGAVVPRRIGRLLVALVLLAAVVGVQSADAQTRFMFLRGQSIHPAYEGWWPNEDGTFTFWFGYMNSNWEEEFNVDLGPDNYFALTAPGALNDLEVDDIVTSRVDQGQPTHFYPRRNPFLFTVQVPADFGDQELVWTLTTHGRRNRVYASLRPDYRMDPQVMSTEVGGAFGSLDDRLRTNKPPDLNVEGDGRRGVSVGEPLTLAAFAEDPDNFPPRSERSRVPTTLDQLYSPRGVGSVVVSGAPGLRLTWFVYRGPADKVSFEPEQQKAWMDSRAWANSPWSPPYVLPDVPEGNKWLSNITFEEPGEYVLRAVASDGSHFSYENVVVQVTK